MAGELRRFWSFAGDAGAGHRDWDPRTRMSAARPPLLAERLPCLELRVAPGAATPIGELLRLAGAR